jgi:hypothetical protein
MWDLPLWKWGMVVLELICGRLVSGWEIQVVVFFIERSFLLRKRVLYFVYGLRKSVQDCLWLGLVFVVWHSIFDDKVKKETKSKILLKVNRVLVCFLMGNLIWLLKTLLVKVLALNFHVNTFFERIWEALFNQYVIETLFSPPLFKRHGLQSPAVGKNSRFSRLMSKRQDEEILIDHLHRLNLKNISAWNMRKIVNIIQHGALSTLDEQIQNSNIEAAKRIFQNVAKPGSQ